MTWHDGVIPILLVLSLCIAVYYEKRGTSVSLQATLWWGGTFVLLHARGLGPVSWQESLWGAFLLAFAMASCYLMASAIFGRTVLDPQEVLIAGVVGAALGVGKGFSALLWAGLGGGLGAIYLLARGYHPHSAMAWTPYVALGAFLTLFFPFF
ncbi:MAG: hypothetical protein KM310_11455 [Clostridiales bacterium]|nr:hypothetical protein [Clostridiales bacterium]